MTAQPSHIETRGTIGGCEAVAECAHAEGHEGQCEPAKVGGGCAWRASCVLPKGHEGQHEVNERSLVWRASP